MRIPAFWKRLLMVVGLAKAAVAGAGLALAILGAFDIAAAITARDLIAELKPHYLDFAAVGGGVIGIAVRSATSWVS